MPQWIIAMLVRLAVTIGLPLLIKKFPGLPAELWKVIEDILKHVAESQNPQQAVEQVRAKVNECTGVGCATTTQQP